MTSTLSGLRIVITGANTGIGRVTAEVLAGKGATLVLAGRSEERTAPVVEAITKAGGTARFIRLDLGDLRQVDEVGHALAAGDEPVDILINNAGLAGARGLTNDGFELAFGTNHLGHFLLTEHLLPKLRASSYGGRIVNVASRAHLRAAGIPWGDLRRSTPSTTGLPEYGVSKLANVLHAKDLATRPENGGILAVSLHPGVIASDVWREVPSPLRWVMKLFMKSNEEGAETTLHCATAPREQLENGGYYVDSARGSESAVARDAALPGELRRRSEEWLASYRR
jgi:NAD(P)-dependent dehydrogenase (short-subunit alcohol dehydrogenase family)